MRIKLKKLSFVNFKGIKEKTVIFDDKTIIEGDNGTGKTTIFDGFTYLLFGKNSDEKEKFSIKTLDTDMSPIHKLEHVVEGWFDADGVEIRLKKVFREDWVKKRGSEVTEMNGHKTDHFYNEVPLGAGEYQKKVNALIEENLFKLITNPHYFNSLKWQDRRAFLVQLAGEVKDSEVAQQKKEFQDLLNMVTGKTWEELRRQIINKKAEINRELTSIPNKISEAQRAMMEEPNYAEIEKEIKTREEKIQEIEGLISDKSKLSEAALNEKIKKQNEIGDLKLRLQKLEFEVKQELSKTTSKQEEAKQSLRNQINNLNSEIKSRTDFITQNARDIATLDKQLNDLRARWMTENAKTLEFCEDEFKCPACKRLFESDDIEAKKAEMTANFNNAKFSTIATIDKEGKEKKARLESLQNENSDYAKDVEEIKPILEAKMAELTELNNQPVESISLDEVLSANKEYQGIKGEIEKLEAELKNSNTTVSFDASELKKQKADLGIEINSLRTKLSIKEFNDRQRKRITELNEEEKSYAQQLANLEKTEFTIDQFEKAKLTEQEARFSKLFKVTKFKLIKQNLNGGEEQCCDATFNGVPYSDLNNAMRINVGLDIINTFSKFYDVYAPVFIDNAESVNQIYPVETQITKLVVTKDSALKISSELMLN